MKRSHKKHKPEDLVYVLYSKEWPNLPVYVGDTPTELSEAMNIPISTIYSEVCRNGKGQKSYIKRVYVGADVE